MIDVAIGWEMGEKREALEFTIANHMKKCYLSWNKDSVDDKVIFDHLFELSEGQINLKNKEEDLAQFSNIRTKKKSGKTHRKQKGRKKRY